MVVQDHHVRTVAGDWYARTAEDVASALEVDVEAGLPSATAAERLRANGPNALPEEKPKPGWRRFLDEYRTYMQIILIATAVVSLAIKQWSTAALQQFSWALVPAVALLLLWELGKLVARRVHHASRGG